MANTKFKPWLGSAATTGQQAAYDGITGGFQAGGLVKAADFNAALRMTTLVCAGVAAGFGFDSLGIDAAESAISDKIKNPVFSKISVSGDASFTGVATFSNTVNFQGSTFTGTASSFTKPVEFSATAPITAKGTASFQNTATFEKAATFEESIEPKTILLGKFETFTGTSNTVANIVLTNANITPGLYTCLITGTDSQASGDLTWQYSVTFAIPNQTTDSYVYISEDMEPALSTKHPIYLGIRQGRVTVFYSANVKKKATLIKLSSTPLDILYGG